MIDIESEVMTIIYNAVQPSYPEAKFESTLNLSPSEFPCVCVEELDNTTRKSSIDSSSTERYANVAYEINIYTNNSSGKKAVAKDILSLIDRAMFLHGFERYSKTPMSLDEGTKYRMIVRYQCAVSADKKVYGR